MLLLLSVIVCCFPSFMAKIFSNDDDLIQGVVDASVALSCLMVTMNLTVALEVTKYRNKQIRFQIIGTTIPFYQNLKIRQ